jgi:hypothetical protein
MSNGVCKLCSGFDKCFVVSVNFCEPYKLLFWLLIHGVEDFMLFCLAFCQIVSLSEH